MQFLFEESTNARDAKQKEKIPTANISTWRGGILVRMPKKQEERTNMKKEEVTK